MDFVLNEYHRNISDEELLSDLRRVAGELNVNTLTVSVYQKYGRYAPGTIQRRFGGWTNALKLCGMQVNIYQMAAALNSHKHKNIGTDELLNDIKRVAMLHNKDTISSLEYQKHGIYSRDTCQKRFSTWNNALQQAGLKPFKQVSSQRLDDEGMLKEIERIWIKLGRQPTSSDIRAGISQYSLHAYAEHFGGWRGALEAFVKYINEEEPATEYINEEESVDEPVVADEESSRRDIVAPVEIDKPRHKTPREANYRLRFKVMQRDNFKCCFCGKSPAKDPAVELHIDHIFPWTKGGETVMDNLQTLCSICNLGKSDLSPV